jgi:UDP-3-O-[3-hydroxymyristoyl] N-acetylglucosamine deacetylase
MDGSASRFVEAIDEVGLAELDAPRRFLKVLKRVSVEDAGAYGELAPHNGFHLDVEIDFDTPLIGTQRIEIDLNPGSFRRELARARTFGFMKDVERLWAAGLALGASSRTPSPSATTASSTARASLLRRVRAPQGLDAVGDLALAGAPILGTFRSHRGGHRLNALVLKALFADADAWTMIEAPRYREVRHAELSHRLAAANFAAERS